MEFSTCGNRWSQDESETLILEMSKRPSLVDRSGFMPEGERLIMWQHISTIIGRSVDDIKKRWNGLVSTYKRKKRKKDLPLDSESTSHDTHVEKWKLFDMMDKILCTNNLIDEIPASGAPSAAPSTSQQTVVVADASTSTSLAPCKPETPEQAEIPENGSSGSLSGIDVELEPYENRYLPTFAARKMAPIVPKRSTSFQKNKKGKSNPRENKPKEKTKLTQTDRPYFVCKMVSGKAPGKLQLTRSFPDIPTTPLTASNGTKTKVISKDLPSSKSDQECEPDECDPLPLIPYYPLSPIASSSSKGDNTTYCSSKSSKSSKLTLSIKRRYSIGYVKNSVENLKQKKRDKSDKDGDIECFLRLAKYALTQIPVEKRSEAIFEIIGNIHAVCKKVN